MIDGHEAVVLTTDTQFFRRWYNSTVNNWKGYIICAPHSHTGSTTNISIASPAQRHFYTSSKDLFSPFFQNFKKLFPILSFSSFRRWIQVFIKELNLLVPYARTFYKSINFPFSEGIELICLDAIFELVQLIY